MQTTTETTWSTTMNLRLKILLTPTENMKVGNGDNVQLYELGWDNNNDKYDTI
jgi:hypothetical protein